MSGPRTVDIDALRALPLPAVPDQADKDGRGRVLAFAGSLDVPGAAILTGEAALRAGAGKLQIAVPAEIAAAVGLAVPEARVFGVEAALAAADRSDAVVVGPGLVDEAAALALALRLLASLERASLVLDAGCLGGLMEQRDAMRRQGGRTVITPHAGEMASLLGAEKAAVEADPAGHARAAAAGIQAVVVLKGPETLVASPDGALWRYPGGGVGLATSGSGDVLAGLVTGLLARGAPPVAAAIWGVWLHGEAGARLKRRMGPVGFLARELAAEVPALLAQAAGP